MQKLNEVFIKAIDRINFFEQGKAGGASASPSNAGLSTGDEI